MANGSRHCIGSNWEVVGGFLFSTGASFGSLTPSRTNLGIVSKSAAFTCVEYVESRLVPQFVDVLVGWFYGFLIWRS